MVFPVIALTIPNTSKNAKCRCNEEEIVCGGITIVRITHANSIFFNGKSNLAKPYPTNVHTIICRTAIVSEITKVFFNSPNFNMSNSYSNRKG